MAYTKDAIVAAILNGALVAISYYLSAGNFGVVTIVAAVGAGLTTVASKLKG